MDKIMQEFTPGKSLFKCTKDFTCSNRQVSKTLKFKKEGVMRLSLLNEMRDDNDYVLLRDDSNGQLVDIWIFDLNDKFIPI